MKTKMLHSMEEAFAVLDSTRGRIFRATFVKKDGTTRDMVARKGVTRHLRGGTLAYDPRPKGLATVFDMHKGAYRSVNVKTLREIVFGGVRYVTTYGTDLA